jgi:translocation and assembly module TamB
MDLKPLKNWQASLSIKGENFEVIDTPELHIFISPDLTVDLAQHKVDIKGKLTIPEASIKPSNFDTVVSSSKDVVIVDPNKDKAKAVVWAVSSEMRLLLGDKVWFDGFGLKAWLKGDLEVSDKSGKVATGRGELGISEGTFRAFGRPLKIDRGRLVFRGGPIDNPGLDVAASRSIDAENVNVSVKIGGTLAEPTFNTSSEPPMAQTDVLSYLLYGKKSDENTSISSDILVQAAASAGIGSTGLKDSMQDKLKLTEFSISGSSKEDMAMTLGSYLSPSLFVGYTFGLFEAESQFQLNYRLSKSWYLEMETSTEASGGDIFYSFER